MELYYHKNEHKNFGDELNGWLWPKIFPEIIDKQKDVNFIGIGTILDKRLLGIKGKKIVFGTGVRRRCELPFIDNEWDIRFVRGPITASSLSRIEKVKYISDSALCLALLPWLKVDKDVMYGFIPHYYTAKDFDCKKLCDAANIYYIDPRNNTEVVINEIRRCKYIFTEAMHGAIVADLFRVPWLRVTLYSWKKEEVEVSNLKWADWGKTLQVNITPFQLADLPVRVKRKSFKYPLYLVKKIHSQYNFVSSLKKTIESKMNFELSDFSILKNCIEEMRQEVVSLKKDYKI